jgi:hypothetical protein
MHVKLRLGGTDSYPLLGSPLAVAPPGCDGHFLPSAYGGSRASDGCRPIGTGAGLAAGVWAAVRQPTFNNPRLSCRVWALGLTILTRRPCRRFNDAMRRWLHGGCETTALQNQRDRQSRRQGDGMRPDGSSRRDVLNRPGRNSRACPQHIHRPKAEICAIRPLLAAHEFTGSPAIEHSLACARWGRQGRPSPRPCATSWPGATAPSYSDHGPLGFQVPDNIDERPTLVGRRR